jgi:hypothetical protein
MVDQLLNWTLASREELKDPPSIGIDDRVENGLPWLEHDVVTIL